MIAYTRGLSNILNFIVSHTKDRFVVSKNNKLEAVIIDIEEYERLQKVYNMYEVKEIEQILLNRTEEEKEVSHIKVIR